MLDALIEWQKRRDCQVRLACEATLNMAGHTRILEKMQQAFFTNCFFGIETPDPKALKAMKKGQNMRMPILEAIQTVNKYGIEAASGIIMGLDTDTDETPQALIDFAEVSQIPIMTVNILYALPNTALYTRLEKDNRVLPAEKAENRDSNIVFLQPYETVVRNWQRVIGDVFSAEKLSPAMPTTRSTPTRTGSSRRTRSRRRPGPISDGRSASSAASSGASASAATIAATSGRWPGPS